MLTQIDYSPIESNILGLRIGRCNSDLFDEQELYLQIVKNDYDLCRLKIPAEDEMASGRLNRMGLPFYFSGSIRRYKTKISAPPPGNYFYPDLVFESYDGTQDKLLKDMLVGTWGTYPIGYYRTPFSAGLVNKEKEIECVFQYYKKFNLPKDYPGNSILFIRHKDAYVGFFALNITGGNLESHIGGILEPYRKSRYFLDMLRYISEFCIKQKLGHFIFGARNENAEVQKIFQFVGFTPTGSENVFHIASLLAYTQFPPVLKAIALDSGDEREVYRKFFNEAMFLAEKHASGFKKVSFNLNYHGDLPAREVLETRFSFPVVSDSEVLVVIKAKGKNAVPVTGYFRAFRG